MAWQFSGPQEPVGPLENPLPANHLARLPHFHAYPRSVPEHIVPPLAIRYRKTTFVLILLRRLIRGVTFRSSLEFSQNHPGRFPRRRLNGPDNFLRQDFARILRLDSLPIGMQ